MKLVTFNILDGGVDRFGSRLDFILGAINAAKPDFLALQETIASDGDSLGLVQQISRNTGLQHYALSRGPAQESTAQYQYRVASLSCYPLKRVVTLPDPPIKSAALHTVIDSPLGELSICNVHLDAYSEDIRLQQLEIILKLRPECGQQILLGDLNSVTSVDQYDPETLQVEPRFDVVEQLKRDYVDVAAHVGLGDRDTHPTPSSRNRTFTVPVRVDYILASHSLTARIKSAAVIKTPDSEQASDHYPIEVTLDHE